MLEQGNGFWVVIIPEVTKLKGGNPEHTGSGSQEASRLKRQAGSIDSTAVVPERGQSPWKSERPLRDTNFQQRVVADVQESVDNR